MTVVCDLDGVVWLADRPIPGVAGAVARLRRYGHRVLFVTNNSFAPVRDVELKLARFGIPADGDVLTSARAAASLVDPGEVVLLAGGPGAAEELTRRGALVVDRTWEGATPGAVVVGFHRSFDYEELRITATAVRRGARLIGTNDDATYPTPDGPIPGAGSILAGVERASGVRAIVAGKPYPPMAELVRSLVSDDVWVVGDRLDTDGRFAGSVGGRFALVLTGVTTAVEAASAEPRPDLVAADLATVAAVLAPRS